MLCRGDLVELKLEIWLRSLSNRFHWQLLENYEKKVLEMQLWSLLKMGSLYNVFGYHKHTNAKEDMISLMCGGEKF
jgi:hypothetical protein